MSSYPRMMLGLAAAFAIAVSTWFFSCVDSRCTDHEDCDGTMICSIDGMCVHECTEDSDCPSGFECKSRRCVPPDGPPLECPDDMVAVANAFCIDRYQASRSDANATREGVESEVAMSVEGVIPWQVSSNQVAQLACEAAGKRLCSPQEWRVACRGPDDTTYSYGDEYDPAACNGIDTFCDCSNPACASLNVCPYPRCYNRPSTSEQGGPCGAAFRVIPTGALPNCTNGWGVYDINGNLWEHVAGGSDSTVRGGAYNCADSAYLHRCDYIPGNWAPNARGFRCCLSADAITEPEDER